MDDTIKTQEAEVKASEGSVEAEVIKNDKPTPAPDTVPLAVFLEQKEDLKSLKKEINELKNSPKSNIEGLSELASKYPDVNEDFIRDMLGAATKEAQKKIEERYAPIIEKQEAKEKQVAFDKAFDNLFDKTIQDNPDLPKNIDKDLVKELALTPKYRNVPLSDVLIKLYGSNMSSGKASSENEARNSAEVVEDIVNFEKITPEQKSAIMADSKARAKYFTWLDAQPGR